MLTLLLGKRNSIKKIFSQCGNADVYLEASQKDIELTSEICLFTKIKTKFGKFHIAQVFLL